LYPHYVLPFFDNFLQDRIGPMMQQAPDDVIHKFGTTFNKGFQQLADTTRALGIPFVIYLHPELPEIAANQYDKQGKEIIAFAQKNNVFLWQELSAKPQRELFRNPNVDPIHYNAKGQAFMAEHLYALWLPYLDEYFKKYARTHHTQSALGAL
ncbi:MAG: hypothetical protein ACK4GN_15045, partial [Runella sp.]